MNPQMTSKSREKGIYHQYSRRRTYVTRVIGLNLLINRADLPLGGELIDPEQFYYAQCDKFGNFDWAKATIYTSDILVGVDNIFVVNTT